MIRSLSLFAVALAIGTVSVVAQTKPSFTGKWKLVTSVGASQTGAGVGGLGTAFSVVQDEKTIAITTNLPVVGEVKTVYNFDGSETRNPLTFNGTTVDRLSKVKWDGTRLVVTTTVKTMGTAAETTQIWSLDTSGNLVVEQVSNSRGRQETTTGFYKKG